MKLFGYDFARVYSCEPCVLLTLSRKFCATPWVNRSRCGLSCKISNESRWKKGRTWPIICCFGNTRPRAATAWRVLKKPFTTSNNETNSRPKSFHWANPPSFSWKLKNKDSKNKLREKRLVWQGKLKTATWRKKRKAANLKRGIRMPRTKNQAIGDCSRYLPMKGRRFTKKWLWQTMFASISSTNFKWSSRTSSTIFAGSDIDGTTELVSSRNPNIDWLNRWKDN